MTVIPFHPDHLSMMDIQPHQQGVISLLPPAYRFALGAMGPAATAVDGDKVVACAGIAVALWTGTLWAFLAGDSGKHFVRLHKCVSRLLTVPTVPRIEASVETNFTPGCRWLELLGFEQEGLMRCYGPDGADHYRYARIH